MKKLLVFLFVLLIAKVSLSAELSRFKGNVSVNGKSPQIGQMLSVGDVLVAMGKNSFFTVRYKDGSRFMMKDGELVVKELSLQKKRSLYHLVKGALFLYVNPKSKRDFNIQTKKVSMAVRGTKFWIKESKKESYLCVCEGSIETSNKTGIALVKRNQDIRVSSDKRSLVVSAPSEQMWKMATMGLKEIDVTVSPR